MEHQVVHLNGFAIERNIGKVFMCHLKCFIFRDIIYILAEIFSSIKLYPNSRQFQVIYNFNYN